MTTLTLLNPQPMETLPEEGWVFAQYTHPLETEPLVTQWSIRTLRAYKNSHGYTFHAWSRTATFGEGNDYCNHHEPKET